MNKRKFRDLTIIEVNNSTEMVIACDSLGGIGSKEQDVIKCPFEVSGYYTTLVVLAELLSYRAKPEILVNNLSFEMEPAGRLVLEGIRKALREAELTDDCMITGSTEENVNVVQTALGVTGIGFIEKDLRNKFNIQSGDSAYLMGVPYMGDEVIQNPMEMPLLKAIRILCETEGIAEILPAGSKGIAYEIHQLCHTNRKEFTYADNIKPDLKKSAGPATCAVVTGRQEILETVLGGFPIEMNFLGTFI
ncbi:MAG: selenophosphate synthase [Eubacteriaceae bacterium]|nr:selenophosphate synthase [Eubacteriaceae bacterium]